MKPTLSVKQVADMTGKIRNALKALKEKDVFIGVPAENNRPHAGENAAPREGGITNAELSYIHEYGAPAAGIPARPHLLPGVEDIKAEAATLLKGAAKQALEGNDAAIEPTLNKIGLLGQNAVRARFQDNDWPPLQDATLDYAAPKKDAEGKVLTDKKGNVKRGKSRREEGKTNPLLDTAQLMKSHTYVIRKKGAVLVTPGGKA